MLRASCKEKYRFGCSCGFVGLSHWFCVGGNFALTVSIQCFLPSSRFLSAATSLSCSANVSFVLPARRFVRAFCHCAPVQLPYNYHTVTIQLPFVKRCVLHTHKKKGGCAYVRYFLIAGMCGKHCVLRMVTVW